MLHLLRLGPDDLRGRVAAETHLPAVPSRQRMLVTGILGFTVLSIAGFVPWAVFGRALHAVVGEAGMYAVCAAVFIGLSGPLLRRLVLGPAVGARFPALFALAFTPYAVAWIAAWMLLGGHAGSLVGLLAGTALMGAVLTSAFRSRDSFLRVVAALFLLNTAGYYVGGWVEAALMAMDAPALLGAQVPRRAQRIAAMLSWGLFYGIGFGAGFGLALDFCQRRHREILNTRASASPIPPP